jgi:hypothetical protein
MADCLPEVEITFEWKQTATRFKRQRHIFYHAQLGCNAAMSYHSRVISTSGLLVAILSFGYRLVFGHVGDAISESCMVKN